MESVRVCCPDVFSVFGLDVDDSDLSCVEE